MNKGLLRVSRTVARSMGAVFVAATLLLNSIPAFAVDGPPADPLPPINLAANNFSDTEVTLTWEGGNGGPADKFVITDQSQFGVKQIDEIDNLGGSMTYQVTGLYPNTAYTFKVAAKNTLTGVVSAFTETAPKYTHASVPTDLVPTPVSDTEVNLAWKTNGTYSIVQNLTTGRDYPMSAFVKNFTLSGLACNTNYAVDVIATNEEYVLTKPSQPLVINAGPCTHFAPIEIHHDNVATSSLDLFWTVDPKGKEDTVVIKQKTQFRETVLAEVNRALVSFHVADLTPNTGYQFMVASKDKMGISSFTEDVPVHTLASVPWNIGLTADSQTQISLKWETDATYVIVDNITNGTTTGPVQRATSAVFKNLSCGTPYDFRITAVNEDGLVSVADLVRVNTKACDEPALGWSSWYSAPSGASAPAAVLGTKIFATSTTSTVETTPVATTTVEVAVEAVTPEPAVEVSRLDQLISQTKFGERSDAVKELQTILREQGYFPRWVRSTGYYFEITKAAVAKYQASK